MKKILVLLSISLLANPIQAAIDWKNFNDLGCIGGAAIAGGIIGSIANSYWNQAALDREKLAATQDDKRTKEQTEREEKQKKERAEQNRLDASITFAHKQRVYAQEIDALSQKKGLDRAKFEAIINSKHSTMFRYSDYFEELDNTIREINCSSMLLSDEENNTQRNFLTKLHHIRYAFNLNFNENKNAEKEEAKRLKHLEEEEKLKLEQERLKVKEQKLRIQVQEGKLEAQKNSLQTKQTVNAINNKIDAFISTQKNHEHELAAVRRIISTSTETINATIGAARAQLAALFVQRFDDAKKEVVAAQANAAPQVIVQQVPPPYNPAAVSVLHPAPSEAIDAMPLPNPPPSYT